MLCILFGLVLTSCSRIDRPNENKQFEALAAPNGAVTVGVTKVTRKNLSDGLTLAAEFRPYQEINLYAKVAGYLKTISVDVGDGVRQGQVIATLEVPEFQNDLVQAAASKNRSEKDVVRARSELQSAQSVYDAAKLTYSRLDAVGKSRPNLLAQQEIDDALAKMQEAEAQLNAAKAALSVAEEQVRVQDANEEKVKTLASYTVITVPFSGVITKRYADPGAMIQQGTASQTQAMPLVRLSQIDLLRLILPVPESVVPRVHVGRVVKVKVPSLNQTFEGKVSRFADKVDAATRTMETEVDVPNPRLILKPGMYAYADLELDQKKNAVVLSVQAVNRKENKASVMLVNAQQKLESREIVTGMETPDTVEVLSGLAPGDLVVIGNTSQLKPGQPVIPKEIKISEEKGSQ
ncbi:MAG: efflux RND transporter periplasmic adaptor subunit [Blastocatellia bacterium]|nr:efflux RND transporter periplasmic adaptor subunit [Blastocatellia bacterium]